MERKQAFVDNSPSQETKTRLQKELDDYREAIAVISEWAKAKQKKQHIGFTVCLGLIGLICILAWLLYHQHLQTQANKQQESDRKFELQRKVLKQRQIDKLIAKGEMATEKRKWSTARRSFEEVLSIAPNSQAAQSGMKAIDAGITEERNQKIFYTLGNSQAAMEAGLWDKARQLTQSVLDDHPDHQEARAKLDKINQLQRDHQNQLKVQSLEQLLEAGQLPKAQQALAELKKTAPNHPEINVFDSRINRALAEIQARQKKAGQLLQQARELDNGQFSESAIKLLDQAQQLDPANPDITALHQKMSAYTRSINVPADATTISEALALARPRDRIVVAAGIYREALVINQTVRLEGSPDGKTILRLPAAEAPLVTVLASAAGSVLSHLTMEHEGFDYSDDRASALIIQGAGVSINSCTINKAAGHGIAIIDGAQANLTACKISDCGWDGISVYGSNAKGGGSRANIIDTYSQNNLQHGIEFWKGGSGSVSNCRILGNGLCGILAMSPQTTTSIQTTLCARNRGAGILISDQVTANITANRCDKNLLSGIVVRGAGTNTSITNSIATGNREVGILVFQEVKRQTFKGNQASGNKLRQIWLDATSKPK